MRPPRKPKLPTPTEERKEFADIPFVEASPTESLLDSGMAKKTDPVTDIDVNILDREVAKTVEVETPYATKSDFSEAHSTKGKSTKVTIFEEVTKTFQPAAIEEDEFSIVVDPTKKEAEKKAKETFTISIDESIEQIEREILEKSPILPEENIMKPLVNMDRPVRPPRYRDHVYEDIEEPALYCPPDHFVGQPQYIKYDDDVKKVTINLIQNEQNFKGWVDDNKANEKQETCDTEKNRKQKRKDKKLFSFLSKKQSKESDSEDDKVKSGVMEKQDKESVTEITKEPLELEERKKSGFLGLFAKKSKTETTKEENTDKPAVMSNEVLLQMKECSEFLNTEVNKYDDAEFVQTKHENVKTEVHSDDNNAEAMKMGIDENTETSALSEDTLKTTVGAKHFINEEVTRCHAVLPQVNADHFEVQTVLVTSSLQDPCEVESNEITDVLASEYKTICIAKSVQSSDADVGSIEHADILKQDIIKHVDVSLAHQETDMGLSALGADLRGLQNAAKGEDTEGVSLEQDSLMNIESTSSFLRSEIDKYQDVKPVYPGKDENSIQATTPITAVTEDVPKENKKLENIEDKKKGGFFGFFGKKSKKADGDENSPSYSEDVIKNMSTTTDFLKEEVDRFDDVRPNILKEEILQKVSAVDERCSPHMDKKSDQKSVSDSDDEYDKKRNSFFGLFTKKSKKPDDKSKIISEEVFKTMAHTSDFLKEEVSRYHDVRPLIPSAEKVEDHQITYTLKNEKTSDEENRTVESEDEDEKKRETLFGLFQRKSKTVEEQPIVISAECIKSMENTCEFLNEEVNRYNDVRPLVLKELHTEDAHDTFLKTTTKVEVEHKNVEDSQKSPLLGLFTKKSKKQEEQPKPISEEAIKDMKDTSEFLNAEVSKYYDAYPPVLSGVENELEHASITDISESELYKTKKSGESSNLLEYQIEEHSSSDSKIVAEDLQPTKLATYDTGKQIPSTQYEEKDEKKPISNETEGKSKGGIFNLFGKKSKKEEVKRKSLPLSEEVVKYMLNTTAFIKEEVNRYHDVRPRIVTSKCESGKSVSEPSELLIKESITTDTCSKPKTELDVEGKNVDHEVDKKSPLFGLFTKKSKQQDEKSKGISEESIKNMKDTSNFLNTEINKYHDARPVGLSAVKHEPKHEGITDMISKSKLLESEVSEKSSNLVDSQIEVQNAMHPSSNLEIVVKNMHDTKLISKDSQEQVIPKIHFEKEDERKSVSNEVEGKNKGGLFSLFGKKSKKTEFGQKSLTLPEEVVRDMLNTTAFIKEEVDRYHDVRPRILTSKCESDKSLPTPSEFHSKEDITTDSCCKPKTEQKVESKNFENEDDKRSPLFGIFTKKSKKQDEQPKTISEESIKNMKETGSFLNIEVNNYHDARPTVFSAVIHKSEHEAVKDSVSELEPLKTENPEKASDLVQSQIEEPKVTHSQIAAEDSTAHHINLATNDDEKQIKTEIDFEEQVETKVPSVPKDTDDKSKGGLFNLFGKKSKKIETEKQTQPLSEQVLNDMLNSEAFLKEEVDRYHDSRPVMASLKCDSDKSVISPAAEMSAKNQNTVTQNDSDNVDTEQRKSGIFNLFGKKMKKQSIDDKQEPSRNAQEIIDISEKKIVADVKSSPKKKKTGKSGKRTTDTESEDDEKGSFFGLFDKKLKKQKDEPSEATKELSEDVIQSVTDTSDFLNAEVQKYHDVRITTLSQPVRETGATVFPLEEGKQEHSTKDEEQNVSSVGFETKGHESQLIVETLEKYPEDIVKNIIDSRAFLQNEVNCYNDIYQNTIKTTTKTAEECKLQTDVTNCGKDTDEEIESATKSTSLFSIFSKKDTRSPTTARKKNKKQKRSASEEKSSGKGLRRGKPTSDSEDTDASTVEVKSKSIKKGVGFLNKLGDKFSGKTEEAKQLSADIASVTNNSSNAQVQLPLITLSTDYRYDERNEDIIKAAEEEIESIIEEAKNSVNGTKFELSETRQTEDSIEPQSTKFTQNEIKNRVVLPSGETVTVEVSVDTKLKDVEIADSDKTCKKSEGFFNKIGSKLISKVEDKTKSGSKDQKQIKKISKLSNQENAEKGNTKSVSFLEKIGKKIASKPEDSEKGVEIRTTEMLTSTGYKATESDVDLNAATEERDTYDKDNLEPLNIQGAWQILDPNEDINKVKEFIRNEVQLLQDDINKKALDAKIALETTSLQESSSEEEDVEKSYNKKAFGVTKIPHDKIEDISEEISKDFTDKIGDYTDRVQDQFQEYRDVPEFVDQVIINTNETLKESTAKIERLVPENKNVAVGQDIKTVSMDSISKTSESISEKIKVVTNEAINTGEKVMEKAAVITTEDTKKAEGGFFNLLGSFVYSKKDIEDEMKSTSTKDENFASVVQNIEKNVPEIVKLEHTTKAVDNVVDESFPKIKDLSISFTQQTSNVANQTLNLSKTIAENASDHMTNAKELSSEFFESTKLQVGECATNLKGIPDSVIDKANNVCFDSADKARQITQNIGESMLCTKDCAAESVRDATQKLEDNSKGVGISASKILEDVGKLSKQFQDNYEQQQNFNTRDSTVEVEKGLCSTIENVAMSVKEKGSDNVEEISKPLVEVGKYISDMKTNVGDILQEKTSEYFKTLDTVSDDMKCKDNAFVETLSILDDHAVHHKATFPEKIDFNLPQHFEDSGTNLQKAVDSALEYGKEKGGAVEKQFSKLSNDAKNNFEAVSLPSKTIQECSSILTETSSNALDTAEENSRNLQEQLNETVDKGTSEMLETIKDSKTNLLDSIGNLIYDDGSKQSNPVESKSSFDEGTGVAIPKSIAAKISDIQAGISDLSGQSKKKVEALLNEVSQNMNDVDLTKNLKSDALLEITNNSFEPSHQKVADMYGQVKAAVTSENISQMIADDDQINQMPRALSDTLSSVKNSSKNTNTVSISEANIDLSNLPRDDLYAQKKPIQNKQIDVNAYVTTPTSQRRSASQRWPKGERPELIDVTNMPIDTSSDDEVYIVTEPVEDSNASSQIDKRKPLFHIASEDDESFDITDKRRESIKSNVLETLGEQSLDSLLISLDATAETVDNQVQILKPNDETLENIVGDIKVGVQSDVDIIEQKLRDLDVALGSLEEAHEVINRSEVVVPTEDKTERKLRRVERKFERMASDALDKEAAMAKPNMSTPELEEKREGEFRNLVSQLSREEVSDLQNEYSSLWEEQIFSPSDEVTSKTPDSQAELPELPKGRS